MIAIFDCVTFTGATFSLLKCKKLNIIIWCYRIGKTEYEYGVRKWE